jgi:hypothetical protein
MPVLYVYLITNWEYCLGALKSCCKPVWQPGGPGRARRGARVAQGRPWPYRVSNTSGYQMCVQVLDPGSRLFFLQRKPEHSFVMMESTRIAQRGCGCAAPAKKWTTISLRQDHYEFGVGQNTRGMSSQTSTSDAEGITLCNRVHALDRVRVVGGAVVPGPVPFFPTYLSVRTFAASRIVWPACVPHCVARIHARMHACVGGRACACARAACSPAPGRGLCPFRLRRLPITGRPRVPSPPARQPPALPACLS